MRSFVFVEGRGVVPVSEADREPPKPELVWTSNHAERRRRIRRAFRKARELKAQAEAGALRRARKRERAQAGAT
jgi:hypothetical protein